jgi:2-polyprenyl-3-methyl-5-hydroxy-6-metoxy-1,4-benzoquinol methylase
MKNRPNKPFKRREVPRPKLPRPMREPGGIGGGQRIANPLPPTTPDAPPTHWGEVADWYDQLVGEAGSEFHREVVLPGAMRLLGAKSGDAVLDIACGQGVLCRLLARQGVQATGIDAAVDLIRIARDRNAQLPSDAVKPVYQTADVRDLAALAGAMTEDSFSAAACLLAIQNINPIAPVFRGVARLLKPMGRLVLVMMHPCFRGPKESSWGWDERAMVQYRRVDRYLLPRKIPIVTHPGKGKDYTWTFHKPIEAYVKALRNAGLLIDAIEEWPSHKTSTSGPRAPAENTARKEIPLFLAIRAVKVMPAEATDGPAGPAEEPEP